MAAFFIHDARPASADHVIWSSTLTITSNVNGPNSWGCHKFADTSSGECPNSLTQDTFSLDAIAYTFRNLLGTLPGRFMRVEIDLATDPPTVLTGTTWEHVIFRIAGQGFRPTTADRTDSGFTWGIHVGSTAHTAFTTAATISMQLIDSRVTHTTPTPTPTPTETQTPTAVVIDPTQRSWPLTAIADESASEWWFPIGRGDCDMKDERRPWTWDRWTPPTADQCGWLSIPDVRSGLDEPVDELAFGVYTALIASPDIGGSAAVDRPRGPSVKLAVWAVYPEQHYNLYNWTRRLKGDSPLTVCLPGDEGQSIHAYDEASAGWVALESVEAEREGHICGLYRHDLGLIVVSSD